MVDIFGYGRYSSIIKIVDVYTFPYVHCWHLRHPLFALFNILQNSICWIIELWGMNYKFVIHTFITPILFAFSNLILYKILLIYNATQKYVPIILVCLFSSFAHVILLAGQYETFPFSLFILLLSLLYLHKPQTTWQDNILFATLTGVTSTNSIKFIFLWLWDNPTTYSIKRFFKSIYLFCFLMVMPTLQLILSSIKHGEFFGHFITNAIGFTYHDYSTYLAIKDNFLSEPLFFHNLNGIIYDSRVYLDGTHMLHPTSNMDAYSLAIIPICIITIYILSLLGIVLNAKTKIVKVMLSFLFIDIFVLLILGYGKNEAHLFCLHWIFILPISIGLLISKLKSYYCKYACVGAIILLTSVALCYNMAAYITSLTHPITV